MSTICSPAKIKVVFNFITGNLNYWLHFFISSIMKLTIQNMFKHMTPVGWVHILSESYAVCVFIVWENKQFCHSKKNISLNGTFCKKKGGDLHLIFADGMPDVANRPLCIPLL